jgi:tight adherence protein B
MSPVILFSLVLILCFGALLYFLKPTRAETAVERQLAAIQGERAVSAGTTILKEERLSSIPWLHELLRQMPGSKALVRLIKQSGSRWRIAAVVPFSLLGVAVAWWLASFWASSVALCAGVGVVVGLAPYGYLYWLREARFRRCETLLPEAVDLMARALRAGHAVASVLEMVGQEVAEPIASEFRTLYEEQILGLPLREAVLNLVERVPRDDMRFLATAILVQKETGGNLAEILDKTAVVMRERVRLRGQLRIYTAQGRVTGWILCCLPFVLFALISVVNPSYEKILFTDPLGIHLIYVGLFMMVVGILVIRSIINIRV